MARTRARRSPRRPSSLVDPVTVNLIVERPMRDALDFLAAERSLSRNTLIRRILEDSMVNPGKSVRRGGEGAAEEDLLLDM